jgi:hypothetical protein
VKITPKDDTFHGNIKIIDIEWWYFDAVFENGYSVQIGFRIYHIRNIGIIRSIINIYKNGKTVAALNKINYFSNLKMSRDYPLMKINNRIVIDFDWNSYKKNRDWRYHVSLTIKNTEVNLTFIGTTKGWKIETLDTCWVVPLPKATVTGTMKIDGSTIHVKGIGYHDHNWSYSPVTVMNNLGWYWGRITADTLNITWAKTIQDEQRGDLLAVVNRDKNNIQNINEFYSIHPKNIILTPKYFIRDHGRKIPTEFDIQIKDKIFNDNISIDANLNMKTIDIQHLKIFIIHYWRYHVKTTGDISVDSKTEILKNKPQIIEYLSFKS